MSVRILNGDCREVLRSLPAESVHCVVTSPPYWGLRDYGTAKWEGGDPGCDHAQEKRISDRSRVQHETYSPPSGWTNRDATPPYYQVTCKCGARRIDSQIGLEPTIGEYVETMVAVFREVRRVLRKDGTLWLNLGDSYSTSPPGNKPNTTALSSGLPNSIENQEMRRSAQAKKRNYDSLKPKDLCGIPWRLAFALQYDGWWLRQDLIWAKPNPMPESVTDRCTKAHEYLFLLSKSATYFYDAEAVKEAAEGPIGDMETATGRWSQHKQAVIGQNQGKSSLGANHGHATRNRRSVWEIATAPFPSAHFATFPPALVEPCVRAGSSERGCCAKCGAPWVREVEPTERYAKYLGKGFTDHSCDQQAGMMQNRGVNRQNAMLKEGITGKETVTLGWSPSCSCAAAVVPCTCLDPFGGAGTTGLVADRLGRNAVLIELNPKYVAMAETRLRGDAPLFAEVAAE